MRPPARVPRPGESKNVPRFLPTTPPEKSKRLVALGFTAILANRFPRCHPEGASEKQCPKAPPVSFSQSRSQIASRAAGRDGGKKKRHSATFTDSLNAFDFCRLDRFPFDSSDGPTLYTGHMKITITGSNLHPNNRAKPSPLRATLPPPAWIKERPYSDHRKRDAVGGWPTNHLGDQETPVFRFAETPADHSRHRRKQNRSNSARQTASHPPRYPRPTFSPVPKSSHFRAPLGVRYCLPRCAPPTQVEGDMFAGQGFAFSRSAAACSSIRDNKDSGSKEALSVDCQPRTIFNGRLRIAGDNKDTHRRIHEREQ